MSAQLVRLAAAVLTSEKGRRTVGWVLAAILSPVILLVAFLCCVGSGTAEHNGAVVSAAFYGTELSESVPTEYRAQLTQMRGSFAHLDAAVAEVNQKSEGNSLDPIQVKSVFLCPSALEQMRCRRRMQRRSWLAFRNGDKGAGGGGRNL